MLFSMASASHLQSFNNGMNDALYWLVALVLILGIELNAVIGTGGRQKYLATVTGTIHTGLGLTVVLYLAGVLINNG